MTTTELLETLRSLGTVVCEPGDVPALVEACHAAGLTVASWTHPLFAKVVLTQEEED